MGDITSEDELNTLAARWGCVTQARLPQGQAGLWVADLNMIILDERLSPTQRRCVLAHEISHAKHRDHGCKTDKCVEERADMDAARLLVNPVEYALAEQVYGEDTLAIARELDVMPWIVSAFRLCLHDMQPAMG